MVQRVLIIAGPTASGKSALAIAVAKEFSGVIINADSMQIYKQMSILTDLGCDFCQGFHISKPLTSSQTLDFIKNFN